MRTTLNIDADVLEAAKERARHEGITISEFISRALRAHLTLPDNLQTAGTTKRTKSIHGFRPFPKRGSIVTNALIDRLRDDDAY